MSRVVEIHYGHLVDLAKALNAIREDNKPLFFLKKPIFETANNYLNMLEEIVNIAHESLLITKRIGKNFRFNPWLGNYWDEDTTKKNDLWIGVELVLSKEYKKIKKIGTGLHFKNSDKEFFNIRTYVSSESGYYLDEVTYPKDLLNFEDYAKHVIDFWEEKLL